MGMINFRNAMLAGGKPNVQFLDWIQSDGSAYIDTGFVLPSWTTRCEVVAAAFSYSKTIALFGAGMSSAADPSTATYNAGRGGINFQPVFNDRKMQFSLGRCGFWNRSANAGNWTSSTSNPVFHTIDFGFTSDTINITSTTSGVPNSKLDGSNISLALYWPPYVSDPAEFKRQIDAAVGVGTPDESIAIFANHYGNTFPFVNNKFRLKSLKFYNQSSVVLADFKPAIVNDTVGVWDVVNSAFHASAGGTMQYGSIV